MATQTNLPNNAFVKFHQFSKMEETEDGAPTVWGIATLEKADLDNERCMYDVAVPVYKAWSDAALKRTKKAGQELSMGPIRLQHSSDVGGKATKLHFDDEAKEIWLGAEPISDEVHQQLKKGFYTGFSQGGSYAWRACSVCETPLSLRQADNYCPKCDENVMVDYGLKRLAEVSFVDSPCSGEGFESVKINGSTSIVKFQKHKEAPVTKEKRTKRVAGEDLDASAFAYVGDPEKTETWKLPIKFSSDAKTKRHIRNALARFEQTKGIPADKKAEVKAKIEAAAKEHGIDVAEEGKKASTLREMLKARIDKAAETSGFRKGLYAVGRFADLLESMACLYEQAVWEREIEGDDSEIPDELREQLDGLIETFIAMAEEEARELSAKKAETSTGENTMTPEELAKAQELEKAAKKSLASHFAKAASHHEKMADHHEGLAEEHNDLMEAHKAAHEGLQECMGKAKKADTESTEGEEGGAGVHEVLANQIEFHKAAGKVHKAAGEKHGKIAKAHDGFAAHLHKMAESHDKEEAEKTVKAIQAEDAANPDSTSVVKTDPAPAVGTIDSDVAKAAAELRNSPEYKKSLGDIAQAQLDAELAELRKKTIVPDGTNVGDTTKFGTIVARSGNSTETLTPRNKNATIAGM